MNSLQNCLYYAYTFHSPTFLTIELPCVNVLSKMDLLQGNSSIGGNVGETEKDDNDSDSDYGYDGGYGSSPMPFNLEFFTQCHGLRRLVDYLDSNPLDMVDNAGSGADPLFDYTEDPEYQEAQARTRSSNFYRKYRKLHHELCDMVEDFSLLSFLPLSIQDAESVGRVVARVDKCNGYVFVQEYGGGDSQTNMQNMFSSAIVADSEWATGVLSDVQEKYLGEVMFREDISELSEQRDRITKKGTTDESI